MTEADSMIHVPDDYRDYLVAGRRAAVLHLIANPGITEWAGPEPEQYDGAKAISVNGLDIGPAIDAAVLETIARAWRPPPRKRAWWRFWG